MTEARVAAALAAERQYLEECDARRRAKSHELHGHGEASVPSVAPDPEERMRRILEVIDAGVGLGERERVRYREAVAGSVTIAAVEGNVVTVEAPDGRREGVRVGDTLSLSC